MKLLLDTHAFLWFAADDPRLSPAAKSAIEDPSSETYLSVASVWEMAIKVSLGKLRLDKGVMEFITEQLSRNAFALLSIELAHVAKVADLPFHHRDPFDRLLVAQCLVQDMPLITRDPAVELYGVTRIW